MVTSKCNEDVENLSQNFWTGDNAFWTSWKSELSGRTEVPTLAFLNDDIVWRLLSVADTLALVSVPPSHHDGLL